MRNRWRVRAVHSVLEKMRGPTWMRRGNMSNTDPGVQCAPARVRIPCDSTLRRPETAGRPERSGPSFGLAPASRRRSLPGGCNRRTRAGRRGPPRLADPVGWRVPRPPAPILRPSTSSLPWLSGLRNPVRAGRTEPLAPFAAWTSDTTSRARSQQAKFRAKDVKSGKDGAGIVRRWDWASRRWDAGARTASPLSSQAEACATGLEADAQAHLHEPGRIVLTG